jgi:tetratricopeptide (TPR) repeat protein
VTLPRIIVACVVACIVLALGLVQFGGERVYRVLDRVAPAAYVEEELASAAMRRGDLDAAQHYAVRMPAGPRRDDFLAQIAQARGQTMLAREYYFAAYDDDAMQRLVAQLAATDIYGALALEQHFRERLIALGTHPDAIAASYGQSGTYEMWLKRYAQASADQQRAYALAPHNLGYLLSAAWDAYFAGDRATARALFTRGLAVDPGCAQCRAGLARASAKSAE